MSSEFTREAVSKFLLAQFRAFHKLLGNLLATSHILSNFLHSKEFLSFPSNSEISEHPLVLKFFFLS